MKATVLIKSLALLTLIRGLASGQEPDPFGSWDSALPLQAGVSDVVGVGTLVSQAETNALLCVSRYWFGDPQTNMLSVHTADDEILPTMGTNFVFFLSKYASFGNLEPIECRYSYLFDMNYHRSRYQPDSLYLLNGSRSWITVTPENSALINWCSNLVYVSQVNTNRQAFYELIRDGYRLHPKSSRIHRDSEYTFMHFHYFNDTNLMQQVWGDTNLVGKARSWVNMSYQQETKTWLP